MLVLEGRGELIADFQQYYTLDFCELFNRCEFERIDILTRQLPSTSRTVVKQDGRARWSEEMYMLALIADHLAFLRYEHAGGKGKRPEAIKRPQQTINKKEKHLNVSEKRKHTLLFAPRTQK